MVGENESNEQLLAERDRLRRQVAELQAEQQKLRETLSLREREVDALLGTKPHPVIARFDRQLRHTYVNAAVQIATGIPPEAHLGKTNREMGLPESILPLWEGALRNVFESGVQTTVEYSVLVANRKWTFQSLVVPELNEHGAVESVLAVTRNITAQKDAEEALLEHTDILETVQSLSQVIAGELELHSLVQVVTDASTELTRAEFGAFFYNLIDERGESYTLYTISGVPREKFAGFPMPRNTHLFAPTFNGEATVRLDDVHQDPRYAQNPPYFGMPKGHLPVTSYLAVPVVSRSKEVLGGLFFGHSKPGIFTKRDERIVEGIAAQAAIAIDNARLYREARDQQKRLQTTLASIGDAVIATDTGGHVTFMNAVAQSLTGWTETSALGKPLEHVFNIVNEFTRQPADNPVAKVLREGGIVGLANHTVLLARDGREIPIDDSGAPIRNQAGELIGVILVFRDITERKQNEQRINLLLELSADFSQALTSNQIAEIVVEKGRKSLGANVGTVAMLAEDRTALEIINLKGVSAQTLANYRRTSLDFPGPLNDSVRGDRILWIESVQEYQRLYPHFAEAIQRNGSRSTVCLPLKVDDRVTGGITFSFPFEKPHNADEEAFFTALANLCAQSLERARLYEAEQQTRTLAEALRDTVVALSSTLDLSEVFDQILNNIDRVVRHDMGDIMLLEAGVVRIVRSHRYAEHGLVASEEAMRQFSLRVDGTYHFKWVAEHKRPSIIFDTQTDKTWIRVHEPDIIRSTLIVPIVIDSEITGFLNVNSLKPGFFTAADGERLQTFADQAAVAIRNAQLHRRAVEFAALEERQRIARDLHDAVSQTLFTANLIAEALPRLWAQQPEKGLAQTQSLHQLTRAAAAEMRVLLVELRPESLIRSNLGDLLTQLGYALPGRKNIGLSVKIEGVRGQLLPPEVQIAFYRIAQEGLNNVIKHGRATEARIRLIRTDRQLKLVIMDNGQGFDIQQSSAGIGLKSMRERASSIQADFTIQSRIGRGTRLTLIWKTETVTQDQPTERMNGPE
jgi:PAS domain S-box-containing protein